MTDLDEVTESADEATTDEAATDGATTDEAESTNDKGRKEPARTTRFARWRNGRTWVALALLVLAVAAGVFGYTRYQKTSGQLASLRAEQSERQSVAKVGKDYAMRSLTYTFEDPDAFFKSVEDGVSPILKDKYENAKDLLKAIMLQAQVTSKGEVLATEVTKQPGDVYQITVAANQTVRNLQNPEERVSNIVLQITVNKVGDKWQVSDIGPRVGSRGPTAGIAGPALKPAGPGAPAPGVPGPIPPPAPKR